MKPSRSCLFTVIFLVLLLLLLAIPLILRARGEMRRTLCMTNMKNLALVVSLHEQQHRRLPPSCHVREYTAADGATAYNKDGYSFLADVLPYMEQEPLWKKLDTDMPLDAENDRAQPDADGKANQPDAVLAENVPFFHCPENPARAVTPPGKPRQMLTSYKAVSASTRLAYEVSSRDDVHEEGWAIYGTDTLYTASDGVMYPGSRTTISAITDGSTNTLHLTETVEPLYSRWIVGQECGLYTMRDDATFASATEAIPYIHPTGYTADRYGEASTIPADRRGTNLNRDYARNPYPWGEPGFRSTRYSVADGRKSVKYGPSSRHAKIVMHAYVSGATVDVSREVDPAAYFFLTTRAGTDPSPCDEVMGD